jgi:selenide,water dikinase
MQAPTQPIPRQHLVLAGGGHTHALVLRLWAMQPQRRPQAWITLVNRHSTALYSGMVPGLVAGLHARDACAIDLRRLADQAGVNFVEAEITGLDLPGQELLLAGRPSLRFDWLSLDVGAVVEDGQAESGLPLPVKPLEPFLQWCATTAAAQRVRVQGSGAAAVEIALALKARGHTPELCTKQELALGSRWANQRLGMVLRQALIGVRSSGHGGRDAAVVIHCTGSRGPVWLGASGLPVDPRGRVRTGASLQVEGHPHLFASGDCGVVARDPRPASGVWAVRAAPVLAANLRLALRGEPLRRWRPQRRALQLLGDGGVHGEPRAIALWGPLALGPSRWLWRWKERIDRRFMERFQRLQPMATTPAMACRGCAAKLAAEPLESALRRLADGRSPQAEDAAVVGRGASGELLLQSVDGFPALVSDPWLNGRLTTLHACSDLWASGARVTSVQVVVTLPAVGADLQADLLHQTLAGVRSVLDPLGAPLLGGHTLEARDAMAPGPGMACPGLGLTLTVNGATTAAGPWPKGPLHPGDALILTRPIGTGVLFAAAMAGAARPEWLDGALAVMQQSQADLVVLLGAHGCHACTDITGFGLLGHLGEMVKASAISGDGGSDPAGVEVALDPMAIPALPGALELLEAGHASTLAASNARALALLDRAVQLVGNQAARASLRSLLIDPQTCGPLLAAVPSSQATSAVKALKAAGFPHATVIGQVIAQVTGRG